MTKIREKVETKMTEPKVQFGLWAMLSFLLTLGAVCVGFLYAEGKETKQIQREVVQRVTKLEAHYDGIQRGLERLIVSVEKVSDKIDEHRAAGADAKRKKSTPVE